MDVLHTFNSFLSIIFVILQVCITLVLFIDLVLVLVFVTLVLVIVLALLIVLVLLMIIIVNNSKTLFQMITIIMYPRLNICHGHGLPHFGLMHLLATNLIIWMRTVIKESIHEYHVAEEKIEDHHANVNEGSHNNVIAQSIHTDVEGDDHGDIVSHIIHKRYSEHYHADHAHIEHFTPESCMEMYHDDDFVSDVLKASSPFLYAFIIEFSLVGGTVFYNTWNNVHLVMEDDDIEKTPNPKVKKPTFVQPWPKPIGQTLLSEHFVEASY